MRTFLNWVLNLLLMWIGVAVGNVIIKQIWFVKPRMLYIPRDSNWQVRQSEKTLTYEIKLDFVDRTNTSAATLQIFPEVKKRRELESVCAAMAEALRRGTRLEYRYSDRYGAALGGIRDKRGRLQPINSDERGKGQLSAGHVSDCGRGLRVATALSLGEVCSTYRGPEVGTPVGFVSNLLASIKASQTLP